jgi:hypothetical protein
MVAGDAVLESNVASSSLRDRPYNETLASVTVSASSLPNIGEDDPVMIDISCFTAAKILDKRSSPFGVEYKCELGLVWLSSALEKEIPMAGVRIRSYENRLIRVERLAH